MSAWRVRGRDRRFWNELASLSVWDLRFSRPERGRRCSGGALIEGRQAHRCDFRVEKDYGRIMFPEHDVQPNGVHNFHDLLKTHGSHCLNHFLQVGHNDSFFVMFDFIQLRFVNG
ncbi:hypothetical protein CDAR_113201 [Caerostris darwini]|uniref:Uncharacterized protein n=1 Tax=Caerostris darwini TaxID=1538125 RepID=A0AAV4Q048_9ARAC|nr:hypothetical protein CDAR_113201 [Caerostris darwini]